MFRKCAATRLRGYVEYFLAEAFINRMEKDPQWPHWRPATPATAPSTTERSFDISSNPHQL